MHANSFFNDYTDTTCGTVLNWYPPFKKNLVTQLRALMAAQRGSSPRSQKWVRIRDAWRTGVAENYYYQEKDELSENIYRSLKSIGPVYSWYASKNIARILLNKKGTKHAIRNLEDEFELLSNPNFQNHYELANFYKDNEYYEKSIKHYSLALTPWRENDKLSFPGHCCQYSTHHLYRLFPRSQGWSHYLGTQN